MIHPTQTAVKRGWILFLILFVGLTSLTSMLYVSQSQASNLQTTISGTSAPDASIHLNRIGSYTGDGAEIPAYDATTERLFIASGSDIIEVLDISDPMLPTQQMTFSVAALGAGANSVAAADGYVAVAVEADTAQDPGTVAFFDVDGNFVVSVTVGALPDMLTFTPDGSKVVVANEGEPNDDYTVDPEGSISVIDISGGVASLTQGDVTAVGFADFNEGQSRHDELEAGVRIYGPGATVAQDLEPEYVAVSDDSSTAWVTLQENNAMAIINLSDNTVTAVKALGIKDYTLPQNQLDPSDEDGGIRINNWPVKGMYQPDAIASFSVSGQTYLLTANEGDAREYDTFEEEERVEDVTLDPAFFTVTETTFLQQEAHLGRLKITNANGRLTATNTFTELYAFGGRSFSIWSADGDLVLDSGSQIAAVTAVASPSTFNSQGEPASFDSRSDDKGAEPEGVTKGVVNGRTYAFVGLERIGGIIVYDVTDPTAPQFIQYQPPLNDDISPEGLLFIPAADSPNNQDLLVVTYEVSGSTTIFTFEDGAGGTLLYLPVIVRN